MFKVERKKIIIFHVVAAVLSIVAVGLTSDYYLWKMRLDKLYPDEIIVMLLIGGLIFALHLAVMPLFDEEYEKLGLVLATVECIVIFFILTVLLFFHATDHLKITVEMLNKKRTKYLDGYWNITAAGIVTLCAAVVYLIELILLFVKAEWLE